MMKNYHLFLEELKEKHQILKEIDFKCDIDNLNSGKYTIYSNKEILQFLYQPVKYINLSDHVVSYGDVLDTPEYLELLPTDNYYTSQNNYKSTVGVFKDSIYSQEVNFIHIQFDLRENKYMMFSLVPRSLYEVLLNFKAGIATWGDIQRGGKEKGNISVRNVFFNNYLYIGKYDGDEEITQDQISVPIKLDDIKDYFINLKQGYFMYNLSKKEIYTQDLLLNGEMYLFFGCHINAEDPEVKNKSVKIKGITYGSVEGYIYLKEINLIGAKASVFAYYDGDICIQYLSNDKKQWKNVEQNTCLKDVSGSLNLRIRMNTLSKLYKLFITTDRLE
ncbi:MAG: hypothetical protein N2645_16420 [Clostridia bacterium]|nr:hypothetical protein [Clostridia bacterium]